MRFYKLLHILDYPIRKIAVVLHYPLCVKKYIHRKHVEVFVGVWIALLGVWIAQLSRVMEHGFFHLLVDGVGYTIHAIGVAPILKRIVD